MPRFSCGTWTKFVLAALSLMILVGCGSGDAPQGNDSMADVMKDSAKEDGNPAPSEAGKGTPRSR